MHRRQVKTRQIEETYANPPKLAYESGLTSYVLATAKFYCSFCATLLQYEYVLKIPTIYSGYN